jgi:hypothetical protein
MKRQRDKPAQPYADAHYRVYRLDDGTFGVDVTAAGVLPAKVTRFATQEDADQWVAHHKATSARQEP